MLAWEAFVRIKRPVVGLKRTSFDLKGFFGLRRPCVGLKVPCATLRGPSFGPIGLLLDLGGI